MQYFRLLLKCSFRLLLKNLYGNEKVKSIARCKVLRCFNKKVSPEAAARLGDDFSLSEVIYAIQRLRNNTSPGPDGLTSELYKQHSSTFGQILKHLFNDALHGRRLPESFKKAVIKVLPKEGKCEDVTCFRPISLINSDQKVLAHLIAERLKSVLTNLIGFEQYAYLKNRNISKALLDLKCRMKLSDWDHCVVKIDFAKAFDRVDRPYMFQLLRKMQLPESLIQLIEEIYYKTKSVIGVNGYFTKEVCIHRGVRQGCPLSALLYIIALEPLLIKLSFDKRLSRTSSRCSVAYADDVTVLVKSKELKHLFAIIDWFCRGTQFKVNKDKCDFVTNYAIPGYKTKQTSKILGVEVGDKHAAKESTIERSLKVLSQSNKYFNQFMSLRGKSKAIMTFVIPKLLHTLRHFPASRKLVVAYQKFCRNVLWGAGRKTEIALQHLERPVERGGIALPNLKCHILAAKINDIKTVLYCDDDDLKTNFNKLFRKKCFELKQNIAKDLKVFKKDLVIEKGKLYLKDACQKLVINGTTTYRDIYFHLLQVLHGKTAWNNRIQKSLEKFSLSSHHLFAFNKWLWKQDVITALEKNTMFKLLYNCIPDRDVLWDKGLKRHPLCFLCEMEYENIPHLFNACNVAQSHLIRTDAATLGKIFDKPYSLLKTKTVATILFGTYTEDKDKTLFHLDRLFQTFAYS